MSNKNSFLESEQQDLNLTDQSYIDEYKQKSNEKQNSNEYSLLKIFDFDDNDLQEGLDIKNQQSFIQDQFSIHSQNLVHSCQESMIDDYFDKSDQYQRISNSNLFLNKMMEQLNEQNVISLSKNSQKKELYQTQQIIYRRVELIENKNQNKNPVFFQLKEESVSIQCKSNQFQHKKTRSLNVEVLDQIIKSQTQTSKCSICFKMILNSIFQVHYQKCVQSQSTRFDDQKSLKRNAKSVSNLAQILDGSISYNSQKDSQKYQKTQKIKENKKSQFYKMKDDQNEDNITSQQKQQILTEKKPINRIKSMHLILSDSYQKLDSLQSINKKNRNPQDFLQNLKLTSKDKSYEKQKNINHELNNSSISNKFKKSSTASHRKEPPLQKNQKLQKNVIRSELIKFESPVKQFEKDCRKKTKLRTEQKFIEKKKKLEILTEENENFIGSLESIQEQQDFEIDEYEDTNQNQKDQSKQLNFNQIKIKSSNK